MLQSNSHLKFADFLISSAELEPFFAYSGIKRAASCTTLHQSFKWKISIVASL